MKTSKNLKFQIPELDDQANVTVIGNALEVLDDAAGDALAMNGDASTAQVTFERATTRENITSKETFGTLMSKISRWFADLKDAAFAQIANNDTTTASGYVADARIVKTHGDEIDTLNTKNGGLYFGQNSAGKWGYKTSANGTVNPFRNPAGNAVAGDVLAGKTFANADSDSVAGTMPNNGAINRTLTPSGNNTDSVTIPAGYTTGGTITANGATAYNAGFTAGEDSAKAAPAVVATSDTSINTIAKAGVYAFTEGSTTGTILATVTGTHYYGASGGWNGFVDVTLNVARCAVGDTISYAGDIIYIGPK